MAQRLKRLIHCWLENSQPWELLNLVTSRKGGGQKGSDGSFFKPDILSVCRFDQYRGVVANIP